MPSFKMTLWVKTEKATKDDLEFGFAASELDVEMFGPEEVPRGRSVIGKELAMCDVISVEEETLDSHTHLLLDQCFICEKPSSRCEFPGCGYCKNCGLFESPVGYSGIV